MLKAIIIDDEQHCIDRIKKLLGPYTDALDLKASCSTNAEALQKIAQIDPDVVFLDVHLQNGTGFDLLAQIKPIEFEIVFTTAHDNYAVEAFRFSALDYLLKPIDKEAFDIAVQKIIRREGMKSASKRLEVLFQNLENKLAGSRKVAITTLEGLTFVKVDDIIRCQSDGNYTQLFLIGNKKLIATKTLKHFEEVLENHQFFRVHKSHYINILYIDKYLKGKGGYVQMSDGTHIEVAVRRKEEFLRKITK